MSSLLEDINKKEGTSKIFIIGIIIAVLAVVAVIIGVTLLPSPEEEKAAVLENAFREGSPEFDEYNKKIIISTDPNRLIESYTGLGDIIMQIGGTIRNRGDKTITGLEVSVGMVNTKNEIIRDKKVLIIPKMQSRLDPDEVLDVFVNIPGFEAKDDRANARWKVTAVKFAEN